MATPGQQGPYETPPSGFGPPAGFTMPGGPKLPGASGEVRTGGTVVLAVVAAALFLPLGVAALVLAIRAGIQAERGQADEARRDLRRARAAGWVGIATGVALWIGALVIWAR